MRILAIDTSTLMGSVALCDGDRLIAEEQLGVEVTHSERLVTTIEHLLSASKWLNRSPSPRLPHQGGGEKESPLQAAGGHIDAIAVAIGPGSFTGLRIGLATAKGLALGLNIPIVGISSLLVLAYNGLLSERTVVSVIDARRAEVYAAAYQFNHKTLKAKCVLKECVCPPELLCQKLGAIKEEMIFVGDGVIVYEKVFRKELGKRCCVAPKNFSFPRASNLAMLAYERLKKGESDDIVTMVPNYLRHSDAEIGFRGNAAKKHK